MPDETAGRKWDGRTTRVVIAHGRRLIRESLAIAIGSRQGFAVVAVADNGYDLLEMLSGTSADVLLLDMNLPELHGLLVMECMAQKKLSIATLVLAATPSTHEIDHAIRLGARGVIFKDSSVEALLEGLQRVVAGGCLLEPAPVAVLAASSPMPDAAARESRAHLLTLHEVEIIRALVAGQNNRAIGRAFNIREQTVKNQLSVIYHKLGVANRLELALYAISRGIAIEKFSLSALEPAGRPGSVEFAG